MSLRRTASLLFCLAGLISFLPARTDARITGEADAIITRARALVGEEEVLRNVRALMIHGREISADGEREMTYHAVLKRPLFQRVEQNDGTSLTATAIDGTEGWILRRDLAAPLASAQVMPMSTVLFRRMRSNTISNLYFYRGYEEFGGEVVLLEEREFAGRPVHVLEFREDPRNPLQRFFDKETGRLVATKIGDGITLIERGEQFIAGIRFPEEIESHVDGELVGRMTLDTVQVNQPVDLGIFQYPRIR
ncbi:MAG: hypothetical protein JJT96_05790 [Opitutales bacterium]|nr:hypothetical protein [Opitutales bacterium]